MKQLIEGDDTVMVRPSGDLCGNGRGYVDWDNTDKEVTLDGDFTSTHLRAIADHMDKFKVRS